MKTKALNLIVAAVCGIGLTAACAHQAEKASVTQLKTVGNPYLPLWEHIPDGEPYVFA